MAVKTRKGSITFEQLCHMISYRKHPDLGADPEVQQKQKKEIEEQQNERLAFYSQHEDDDKSEYTMYDLDAHIRWIDNCRKQLKIKDNIKFRSPEISKREELRLAGKSR